MDFILSFGTSSRTLLQIFSGRHPSEFPTQDEARRCLPFYPCIDLTRRKGPLLPIKHFLVCRTGFKGSVSCTNMETFPG